MKLLIVGSRSIKNFSFAGLVPKQTSLIITGGADGIDALAEGYADKNGLSKLVLRPRYDLYGRCAPLKRNEKMAELCDMALIIWDGTSRGTEYTAKYARKIGKEVVLILKKEGEEK